jgi:MFS family permease
MIIYAPSWGWIVAANILLGLNQGLAWSMAVIMKIDLAGPRQRGLAVGLNEFAGYLMVGLTALATGYLASVYGLRPAPFYLGIVYAVLGLLLSWLLVRETRVYTQLERPTSAAAPSTTQPTLRAIFARTTWGDRTLFAACQAGLVNNLNDGMSWGILPIFFAAQGLHVEGIGILKFVYPTVWSLSQIVTGPLADRLGRRRLIAAGMALQALSIWLILAAGAFDWWLAGSVLLGIGTAMVYPALLAVVSDAAAPEWRARSLGVYRFWRDLGYAIGALLAGVIADLIGLGWAIGVVGGVTLLSGVVVAIVMAETRHGRPGQAVTTISASSEAPPGV